MSIFCYVRALPSSQVGRWCDCVTSTERPHIMGRMGLASTMESTNGQSSAAFYAGLPCSNADLSRTRSFGGADRDLQAPSNKDKLPAIAWVGSYVEVFRSPRQCCVPSAPPLQRPIAVYVQGGVQRVSPKHDGSSSRSMRNSLKLKIDGSFSSDTWESCVCGASG